MATTPNETELPTVTVTAPALKPNREITGPFGSSVNTAIPEVTDPALLGGAVQSDGPRVCVTDETVKGDRGFSEARQARDARAQREDSGILVGIGAAINTWDTTRLVKRLGRPTFDDDTPINQHEYLENTPLVLTEDEREYFLDVGRGVKSAQYAMDQITDRRQAVAVMGDHPVVGLVTSFADPLWLAVPPALRLGKVAPKAGRVISGVTAGALGAGVTAAGEGPVSDTEIALSLVLNSAAGAALYKPGKGLVRADADFPTKAVDDVLAAAEQGAQASVKPRYRLVEAEKWEEVDIPEQPAKFEFQEIRSPELDNAKPGYSYQSKKFAVEFDNPLDKAAYIVAGKSKAHQAILDWAVQTSGLTEAQLIGRGEAIRADLKVRAKSSPEGKISAGPSPFEFKPRVKQVKVADAVPARKERRKVQDAKWEEVPQELQPGAVNTEPKAVVQAVETALGQESRARGLGAKLMYNMHKTMQGFGAVGKKVADILYDNNSDPGITSVESHREAILSNLRTKQFEYEDLMRQEMAAQGASLFKMVNPLTSREAYAVQARIEREVQRELFRREQFQRQGLPLTTEGVNPKIAAMADKLDELHKQALSEMKAAGVEGAENVLERAGYMNRKWNSAKIDDTIARLEKQGLTREQAHAKVTGLVSLALRRANSMDKKLADQVGQAIVDRALRKGYFEDSVFNAPAGEGQLKELRDILKESKMPHDEIERALNVLRVASDDAGKAGYMKHRMDLDYRATMRIGSENISIMDLIDSRVSTIVDQYVQQVATNSAFARKGLRKRSDIEALREELLHDVPMEKRKEAADLFDNTMAYYRGDPAGAKVNDKFRLLQSYGRTISLAWSGLWQMIEYAIAMCEYGLVKTLKYAAQEMPGFKSLMRPDRETARSLNNVLAEHSSASLRLRPFIARFEDGYEMDMGNALQLSAQSWGQMVPYANAMKFVHHHQARVVGNLILDRVEMAAKGNTKAREALEKYGLGLHVMDKLAAEIKAKGFDVDQWDDAVWAEVRPAFAKMMDASVLKGRLGDIPAFAAFDPVGKFIFTYRTFVLVAHNKVLAGGLERNGAAAVGLVLMYQMPLALAAVQAQSVIRGEGVLESDDLVKKAIGQMGGLGLFSEPLKWATGESNAVGAPGLIPIDRGVKLFQSGINLDAEQGASTALTMMPVISAVPFIRGMAQQIKE